MNTTRRGYINNLGLLTRRFSTSASRYKVYLVENTPLLTLCNCQDYRLCETYKTITYRLLYEVLLADFFSIQIVW
jgi:hypothetical protein